MPPKRNKESVNQMKQKRIDHGTPRGSGIIVMAREPDGFLLPPDRPPKEHATLKEALMEADRLSQKEKDLEFEVWTRHTGLTS